MTRRWWARRCRRCGALDPYGVCLSRCFRFKVGVLIPDKVWAAVRRAGRR